MRNMMARLLALQKLELDSGGRTAAAKAEAEVLRREIPPLLLSHYDRFAQRGKKGVALARNGVCSECHIRMPVGKLAALSTSDEVHRCDNCGRYLYLPEGDVMGLSVTPASVAALPAKPRRSRKTTAHVL
jgi:predicted  nucleic acid-binding Zn-ribbon protein